MGLSRCLVLLLFLYCQQDVSLQENVGGTIQLQFLSYERPSSCSSCEVKFTFCLAHKDHGDSISGCLHGATLESDAYDQDIVHFSGDILQELGIPDPWAVRARHFSDPKLKLVIRLRDDKPGFIGIPREILTWSITWTTKPAKTANDANWVHRLASKDGHKLRFQTRTFCNANFFGPSCSVKCEDSPDGRYTCDPDTGTQICNTGKTCEDVIDPCQAQPCLNNGVCFPSVDGDGAFSCNCLPEWEGDKCQIRKNPCDAKPCLNSGICTPSGDHTSFGCQCQEPWEGNTCDIKKNPCDSSPCGDSGTCQSSEDSNSFTCQCFETFTGETCETKINPCDSEPCLNSGSCTPATDHSSFTCQCVGEYEGETCENRKNPCEANPCLNAGSCTPSGDLRSYNCKCPEMWEGERCQTRKDPCTLTSTPCENSGVCRADADRMSYSCTCPDEYEGERCEKRKNPCEEAPCENGGVCRVDNSNNAEYVCECKPEWEGRRCTEEKDPCKSQPCENGGSCTAVLPSVEYSCSCVGNYSGPRCEQTTTADPSKGNLEEQVGNDPKVDNSSSSSSFNLWWIPVLVVCVVAVIIVVIFVAYRRNKAKKPPIVMYQNGGETLAFDNNVYGGEGGNAGIERQTSRDLPPPPPLAITIPNGSAVNYSTPNGKAHSRDDPDYSELDGTVGAEGGKSEEPEKTKRQEELADLREEGGVAPVVPPVRVSSLGQTENNPYHDFDRLKRQSQSLRLETEDVGYDELEEPDYRELDETAISLRNPRLSMETADRDEENPYIDPIDPPERSTNPYNSVNLDNTANPYNTVIPQSDFDA